MDIVILIVISYLYFLINLLRVEYYNCIDFFVDCIVSEYVIFFIGYVEFLKRVKK